MTDLVRYDTMCTAIAECHSVDEVKDVHDKALALELYARQAKNLDAERRACEVRLRAERRVGELLSDLPRGAGRPEKNLSNDAKNSSPYRSALESAGISYQTANRYQELADVPIDVFERHLREAMRPTTNAILADGRPPEPVRCARCPTCGRAYT